MPIVSPFRLPLESGCVGACRLGNACIPAGAARPRVVRLPCGGRDELAFRRVPDSSEALGLGGRSADAAGERVAARCSVMDAGRSTFERPSRPPLVYRRRAFPWRDAAPSASTARTLMYSLCWASAAPASARPPLTSLLLTTQNPSPRGDALAATPSWQTVVMLLEACGSATPLLHGMLLALALAQQLALLTEAPHVIMVTCGAVAFGDVASDAAHGGAWGFARVQRLEHAALRTQSADIARGESLVALAVLLSPTTEAEAARAGNVHGVARLRACTLSSSKAHASLAAGAYTITGGLGGLGLCAAKLVDTRTSMCGSCACIAALKSAASKARGPCACAVLRTRSAGIHCAPRAQARKGDDAAGRACRRSRPGRRPGTVLNHTPSP